MATIAEVEGSLHIFTIHSSTCSM